MKDTCLSYIKKDNQRIIEISNTKDLYAYINAQELQYKKGILLLKDIYGDYNNDLRRSVTIIETIDENEVTTCVEAIYQGKKTKLLGIDIEEYETKN